MRRGRTTMYRIPVYRCALVRERSQSVETRPVVNCPEVAAQVLRAYLGDADREVLAVLLLNARNRIVGVSTVSVGTVTESVAHPREVFKAAILLGAVAVVVGHNHPSGELSPSTEDVSTTKRLMAGGKILGIDVLDHVIVTDQAHVSLKESGLI